MKRTVILLMGIFFLGGAVFSVDLTPVGEDMETFLERFGREAVPYLQQNALTGEGLGIAQFNDHAGWYIAVTPSLVLTHGMFDFLKDDAPFQILDVDGMITSGLAEAGAIEGYYEEGLLPIPFVRLNVGFALPLDLEMSLILSVFPQLFTDLISGAIGFEGVSLSRWNAGVRLRKPLIQDAGGFPAVSLGLGYTFSTFNFGYGLPEAEDFTQEIGGADLSVQGDLNVSTYLHTFGIDLALSKKILVFVPFVKLSSYYQIATFDGAVDDFDAELSSQADSYTDQGGEDPSAEITLSDLSFLTTAGFEILLGKFAFVFDGNYSFTTNAFALNLGFRLGF